MPFKTTVRVAALTAAIIAACTASIAARADSRLIDQTASIVTISRDLIDAIETRAASALAVNLSKDVQLSLVIQDVQTRSSDSFTCTGTLAGEVGGQFVMAAEDGALIANIWSPQHGTIQIRPLHDDQFRVERIDPLKLGGCGCGIEQQIGRRDDLAMPAQPPDHHITRSPNDSSCDQVIDVLVLYTDLAASAAGGESIIRAMAYASVASANIAYANSSINAHLRLVYVAKTTYVETGNPVADLTALRNVGDGQIDEADTLREQYGADLVSLLIGSIETNLCGVAFVMTDPSMPFDTYAFSVVHQSCALSNLSFAHELAHNLGCQHDWSDPSAGAFPYSHGLRFTGSSGQQWRTVMGSTPGTRIPWFSNPEIVFDGVPTGVPIDQPNPADNALTINNTASIAASFRTMAALDCNGNGNPDACDIAEGISLDLNRNGVPDECDLPGNCPPDEAISLVAPDAESFDQFGIAVSMGGDRVLVGSELDDDHGTQSGSAYVFVRDGSAWTMEAKLLADDGNAFDRFGHAVAISPDGVFSIVGAYRDAAPLLSDSGSVYFFRREDSRWIEDVKIPNPDAAQADWFGWSVSFGVDSTNALFAVVGAPFDDQAAFDAGAAYVFVRNGSGWQLQTKLMAADAHSSSLFGHAVAAAAGDRIVIGAGFDDAIATDAGAAYVFRRDGDAWVQEAKLTAPPPGAGAGDRFGAAVAINGDRVLIGSPRDDDAGLNSGAAFIFRRSATTWTLEQQLEAQDAAAGDFFGTSVALHDDQALVGSILSYTAGAPSGAVYEFQRGGGSWTQQAKIAPQDAAAFDNFGVSLSIEPVGGALAAAGSYLDDHDSTVDGGSVRIFALKKVQPDCNGNGVSDACDIANGTSLDRNGDGVPDECQAAVCPGDVSGDGTVNAADLLAAINAWGPCPTPCPQLHCAADIDGTCSIDATDLMEIILHWGDCP